MASGDEHIEIPSGSVNGTNTVFYVSLPYVAGSVRIWVGGMLLQHQDTTEGIIESDPATGEIEFYTAPTGGSQPDVLHVRYIEAA
jgi:hypothetical protein